MNRTIFFGFFVSVFGNGGFFVILYYLQIWFQAVKDATPLKSGIMYLPTVGADISAAIVGGGLGSGAFDRIAICGSCITTGRIGSPPRK